MTKNITKAKHRFPLRQIRHIPRFFRRHWPVFALTSVSTIIAYLNYEPGTFLSGWDNLHPEFDIWMNFKRTIFSVWQEYRGTGLLSGQAPAADLPRILFIALLQFLNIPTDSVRYLTTFLPLVFGPLGVYFLFYHHLFREKLDSATTQFASFFGGLFYLLNLNTLQTFFVPFETFTWFYGSLPYLLYFTLSYLKKPSLKKFSTLLLVSFLTAPSFYVETIFLVFFVTISSFIVEYFYQTKKTVKSVFNIIFSFISLILPHLFWLLPIIFFVFTKSGVVETAKINNISSPETFYRNLEFSTIKDLALMKSYLFNYLDMSSDFKYDYLLSVWRNHLSSPLIYFLGLLTFATAVTGFYYSLKKKFAWTKAFIGTLFVCLFFLLGGGLLLNRSVPLIGELFRSPFTKFSIPFSLCYSFFFAIGTIFILDLFTYLHSRLTYFFTLFSIVTALFIFMSPVFSGNLISPKLQVRIPPEYFELFDYMKTQDPATRVANFPQNDFWGWLHYDWGYRGSGFLWHGLKQTLMDRAFDVWEKTNEEYYQEISTAIYSNDQEEFENIIDKYTINWLLLDKHVIAADGTADLGNTTLEKFLTTSSKFSLEKSFNNQIYLYKSDVDKNVHNFLSVIPSAVEGSPSIHPFSSLSLRPNTDWVEKGGFLSTSTSLPTPTSENQDLRSLLSLPSLTSTETLVPVFVEYSKSSNSLLLRLSPITPVLIADEEQINLDSTPTEITIPIGREKNNFILQLDNYYWQIVIPPEVPDIVGFQKLASAYLPTESFIKINLYDSLPSFSYDIFESLSQSDPVQCYLQKPNRKIEKINTVDSISLLGTDVVGCLSAPLPSIPTDTLISLNFSYSSPTQTLANANISGKDLASQSISQPLESRKEPRQAQVFTISTGEVQQANFILEASDTKSVQEINYQDISLSIHSLLFSSSGKLNPILEKVITLNENPKNIQFSLPLSTTTFDIINTPSSNSLLPENLNCDQFNDGKTVKTVSENDILYQSQNAIECDYQNLRHLPHSLSYLISIETRNIKGLPLTLCMENFSTRRCDVFDRLADSGVTQYLVNPIKNIEEAPGSPPPLFNQSIGTRVTANALKPLSIHPIPLNFLKSISLTPASPPQTVILSDRRESKDLTPLFTSTHPAEYLYTISIPNSHSDQAKRVEESPSTPQPITLNLYQTNSSYWKAIQISQDDLQLNPWLLTAKIFFTYPKLTKLTHTDTGLWYNSWSLPTSDISLVLIYLPQYLEFIGLSILILIFPVLLLGFLKIHKK